MTDFIMNLFHAAGTARMMISVVLFMIGLVCLIKGGDWFVDGATAIAKKLHVPELIIGATIVSIGTTLPEVMVSATSAVKGIGDMAYGNAIGSVICNTALISAVTIAVKPTYVNRKTFIIPVSFFFAAAVFYSFVAYYFREFSRPVGIILLCGFVAYMVTITIREAQAKKRGDVLPTDEDRDGEDEEVPDMPVWKMILFLILGAAMIAVGANLLVDNGTIIATALGVPDTVIALTFIALGTSLPELVTAITSLAKGHGALSLGNIIGANLFNLVLVCGVSTTIAPFPVPTGNTVFGMSTSLVVEIPLMILVMLILCLPALIRQKLSRVQGILLLVLYAGFVIFQFVA